MHKICTNCNQKKPIEDFKKDKGGFYKTCYKCRADIRRWQSNSKSEKKVQKKRNQIPTQFELPNDRHVHKRGFVPSFIIDEHY